MPGMAGRDAGHALQAGEFVAQAGQQVGRKGGGSLGRALDEPGAAGLVLVLADHVQVDAGHHLVQVLLAPGQVGTGAGHLWQPQEADGALWGRQLAAGDQRLQRPGRLQGCRRPRGIVVGRGQGVAEMGHDDDLARLSRRGWSPETTSMVPSYRRLSTLARTRTGSSASCQQAAQRLALAGCQDKAKALRVARLPPEGGVLADVGQVALGSHRRHGPHAVKEDADGAALLRRPVPSTRCRSPRVSTTLPATSRPS